MTQPSTAPLPESGKPKLLDQVRHRCRARHLAQSTERAYVNWIRRFILFHQKRHPLEMGGQQVSEFLTHLAVAGHVAASTQNQALSALLFLYREVLGQDFGWLADVVRANKPKRLPVVYTPEEAMGIIGELIGLPWLMGMQLYGGGCYEPFQQRKWTSRGEQRYLMQGCRGGGVYADVPLALLPWMLWGGRLHVGGYRVAGAGSWRLVVD